MTDHRVGHVECRACGGDGSRVVGHDPIEDQRVVCEACGGTGFEPDE